MSSTTYEVQLRIVDRVSATIAKVDNALSKLGSTAGRVGGAFGRMASRANSAFSSVYNSIFNLKNAIAGLATGAVLNSVVQTTAEMQSLENSIKFASGSAEEGATNLKFLADISKQMGLNQQSATEGFRTLSGAFMGTSLQGEQTRKIFEQVTYGVTAMGLSSDAAKGTFLALGQIMSKGKVSAEELRGQIGERIPGAFGIAARAMGVTTAQLDKMMQNGELMSETFLPKFAAEMEKTFKGGAMTQVDSLTANINRLQNSFMQLSVKIGTALTPVILQVMDGLTVAFSMVGENLNRFTSLFYSLWDAVSPIIQVFKELTQGIGFSGDIMNTFFEGARQAIAFIAPIIQVLMQTLYPVLTTIVSLGKAVYDGFLMVYNSVANFIGQALPYIQQLIASFTQNIDLTYILSSAFELLNTAIVAITPWIIGLLRILTPIADVLFRIIGFLTNVAVWIVKAFGTVALKAVEYIGYAFDMVAWTIEKIVGGLMSVLKYLGLISSKSDEALTKAQKVTQVKQSTETKKGEDALRGLLGSGILKGLDVLKGGNNTGADVFTKGLANSPALGSPANKETKKGLDGISGGGSKPTNIHISIGKLNETIEINTVNLKESESEIEKMFINLLLKVTNSANQVMAQ